MTTSSKLQFYIAKMAVIIFVMLAGSNFSFIFFSKSTFEVEFSNRIAEPEVIDGSLLDAWDFVDIQNMNSKNSIKNV